MNILITGGAGFIGSHAAEALLSLGHDVCLFDSFNDYYDVRFKRDNAKQVKNTAEACGRKAAVAWGDICDAAALKECFALQAFDAVIHLAACAGVRPSIENAPLYADVNVNGTVQVLESMKEYGVKKLLFASSSSVYGNNEKTPFSETDSVDNPISPYAATKKAGELVCCTYSHLYGMSIAALRFFTVFGPRQRPDLAIYKFTEKIINGKPLPFYGDGSTGRDYTYIDDIVAGVLAALEWAQAKEALFEVFNLGNSYPVKLAAMVKALETEIGVEAMIEKLPIPPGDVNLTWADISKSKKVLGYNPGTSFDSGIKKFVAWYRENRIEKYLDKTHHQSTIRRTQCE